MLRLVEEGRGASTAPSPVNSGKERKKGKILSLLSLLSLKPPQERTLASKERKKGKIVSIVFKTSASGLLFWGWGCLEGLVKTFNKRVKMGQGQNVSK